MTLADLTVNLIDQQDLADMVIRTFHLTKVCLPAVVTYVDPPLMSVDDAEQDLSDRAQIYSLDGVTICVCTRCSGLTLLVCDAGVMS